MWWITSPAFGPRSPPFFILHNADFETVDERVNIDCKA